MDINDLREKINTIDFKLLDLLNRRAELALDIGRAKKSQNMQVQDNNREQAIIENLIEANPGPLKDADVREIYSTIIRVCRNIQL